jgi:hypothetical protein
MPRGMVEVLQSEVQRYALAFGTNTTECAEAQPIAGPKDPPPVAEAVTRTTTAMPSSGTEFAQRNI